MQMNYHKNYNFIEKYQNLNINDCIILSIIFSFTDNKREYNGGYLYAKKFVRIGKRQYYRILARLVNHGLIVKTEKNIYKADIDKIKEDYATKDAKTKITKSKTSNKKENQDTINELLDKYEFNEELRSTLYQFLKTSKVKNKELIIKAIIEQLKTYSNAAVIQLLNEMLMEDRHVIYFDRLPQIQKALSANKRINGSYREPWLDEYIKKITGEDVNSQNDYSEYKQSWTAEYRKELEELE